MDQKGRVFGLPTVYMLKWEFAYHQLGSFDENCARFYTAEILVALQYVHSQNIIHRYAWSSLSACWPGV